MDPKKYWEIYNAVSDVLYEHGLSRTDTIIDACVDRVNTDADEEWNDSDIRIAIQNVLNELIENM